MKNISRRKFIGQASCAALGSTTLLSTLSNMMMANQLASYNSASSGNYKALVCIMLSGGNDSYNMVVPRGISEYADYAATRADLALDQNVLLPLNPNTPIGKDLGLHPSMGGVQNMFNSGNAAIINNVGTLIERVNNYSEYQSGAKQIPLGLYSHSDQLEQWQTSIPNSRSSIGWGGKVADMLKNQNPNQDISMNISLSGRNIWQTGNSVLEYSINNQGSGVEGLEQYRTWMGNSGFIQDLREQAVNSMAGQMYSNNLQNAFGTLTRQSLESLEIFKSAVDTVPAFATNFSDNYLSENLAMAAKVIGAQNDLGMCRQTFFMNFGGWDHHDEVFDNQELMLGQVSDGITEFFQALEEIGMEDKVTLFTISDFARTLTSNGRGSDHGWAGNAIVAGGAVNGKEFYGSYPDLNLSGNPLMADENRGRLIPTTSVDEYFAELALWFGVPHTDLPLILPNIGNFYSPNPTTMPLGFLSI